MQESDKKIIVPYTLAQRLKELGFQTPVNKMYAVTTDHTVLAMYKGKKVGPGKFVKFNNGDLHECYEMPYNWNNGTSQTSTMYVSAPTKYEALWWLGDACVQEESLDKLQVLMELKQEIRALTGSLPLI